MTFLAPIAWSLLALAVPVVALYLIKTRLRRRPVTTLLFWEQLRPPVYSQSLWRKLRRLFSLLLQLAFLTLLVFALARPLARWESAGRRALVIVLDPSPSTLATDVSPDRWTQALDGARRQAGALRFSDECALILAESPPRVLSGWTGSRRALGASLEAARDAPRHTAGSPDGIRDALVLARHLADSRPHGRIALYTDGAWTEPPDPAALTAPDIDVTWLGSANPVNTAVTAFAARRSLAAPGDYLLAAEVAHFGETAVDGELEITRNGHVLDVQPLHLEAKQPWRKTWTGHADDAVKFEAHLRTFASATDHTAPGPDQLAADNDAQTALAAVQPVRVELVAPANGFLDAALAALPAVEWHRRTANEPPAAPPAALTIFYQTAPLADFSPDAAALLIDPPGGGFWGEPETGGAAELERPLVSDYERDSVPLRFVGLDSVSLEAASGFRPAAGAEVFAQSFGKPLIFGRWPEGPASGRRWLALPFDLENTDFVLRTAFPVMLGNLVQSLRASDAPDTAGGSLPGAIKSRLTRTVALPPAATLAAANPAVGAWWAWAPLWWWAGLLAACWLLLEWWTFSRRITE